MGSIFCLAWFISLPAMGLWALSKVGIIFISAVSVPLGPVISAPMLATSLFVFARGREFSALAKISLIFVSMIKFIP